MKIRSSIKRKLRNRKNLKARGYSKMRISVYKSLKNLSAQIIDDKSNKTLVSVSSIEKTFKSNKDKKNISDLLGQELAKRAKDKKIDKVYFDRGEYKYHGRIKLFAESLRKIGLKF